MNSNVHFVCPITIESDNLDDQANDSAYDEVG